MGEWVRLVSSSKAWSRRPGRLQCGHRSLKSALAGRSNDPARASRTNARSSLRSTGRAGLRGSRAPIHLQATRTPPASPLFDGSWTKRRPSRPPATRRAGPGRREIFPTMAIAPAATRHLGATALLGKGLTPGKLRGLQRISNPNGTLTMLALRPEQLDDRDGPEGPQDQGAWTASRSYDEIVEAKLDLMKADVPRPPRASSSTPITAPGRRSRPRLDPAAPRACLIRVEKSGSRQEQAVGGPMGEYRAGLVGREDQVDGGRRRQAPRPLRAGRA